MFINSFMHWSFGFSHILFLAFCAGDAVYHIVNFTSDSTFWWDITLEFLSVIVIPCEFIVFDQSAVFTSEKFFTQFYVRMWSRSIFVVV